MLMSQRFEWIYEDGTETILVVGDEPAMIDVIRIALEKQGYTVFTALNPAEALKFSAEYKAPLHLLLTDVIMPGMIGKDLVIKIIRESPGLKCLFM